MYPIVGTIGYILPLCGEEKTTAKNFAKYFRKEKIHDNLPDIEEQR